MPDLQDIHKRQNAYLDSLVSAFEQELRKIVLKASARVTGHLQKELSITDGVISQTAANNRILRRIDTMFVREMNEAGFEALVGSFVAEFPGQLPFLHETIDALISGNQQILPYSPSAADLNIMASYQVSVVDSLETLVEGAAGYAIRGALLSVGGLKFSDLVETLAEKFVLTVARATTLADTAGAIWYRTATDRAFQAIENDLPSIEIRYKYTSGPDDSKTRPFCHSMITQTKAGKTWTRAEIGEMDNHQLPNVLATCGGWSCRHQWLLAIP
jgi:hypothetical protein